VKFETFIQSKKNTWYRLDYLVHHYRGIGRISEEELSEMVRLYRSVCSDYAYALSNFPYEPVVAELNTLIGKAHKVIYGSRTFDKMAILRFFTHDFPGIFRKNIRYFWISLLLFVLGAGLSFTGSFLNPDLPRHFLGDAYVDKTLANIEKEDPFAIYKSESSPVLSSFVMTNNIKVTFFAYGMGIFAGIGTIYVLFYNGLIMGVFLYVFFTRGLLFESLLTVMMHGTIELSCIFIAGAAGLMIGRALLFPGTYTRREALKIHGLQSIKLILGTAALLLIAGFIEGFVTRIDLPVYLKGAFVIANAVFLVWYLGFVGRNLTSTHEP